MDISLARTFLGPFCVAQEVAGRDQRPGLKIELLMEEKLVLVTTSRRGQAQRATDYVFGFPARATPERAAVRQVGSSLDAKSVPTIPGILRGNPSA